MLFIELAKATKECVCRWITGWPNSDVHAGTFRYIRYVAFCKASDVQGIYQYAKYPPEALECDSAQQYWGTCRGGLCFENGTCQRTQNDDGIYGQDPSWHHIMHWKPLDVENDMVLKDRNEECACRIDPVEDLHGLDEPWTARGNAVLLYAI